MSAPIFNPRFSYENLLTCPSVVEHLSKLLGAYKSIREIWLVGSRANGHARPDSDWDFFVFADDGVFQSLATKAVWHHANVDLLVSTDGQTLLSPWSSKENAHRKKLYLHEYNNCGIPIQGIDWQTDLGEATYFGDATKHSSELKAYRIYESTGRGPTNPLPSE